MEGGYDFVYSFEHAYRALGGRVVARHVGEFGPQSAEFDGLRTAVFSHRPDAVVALYSGPQLARFGRWWQAHAQSQGAWGLAGLPWLEDVHTGGNAVTAGAWPALHRLSRFGSNVLSGLDCLDRCCPDGCEAGYSIAAALDQSTQGPSASALHEAWMMPVLQGPARG
ncbi:hypothetical protein ACFODQ_02785 [Comamonas sp. JC664]